MAALALESCIEGCVGSCIESFSGSRIGALSRGAGLQGLCMRPLLRAGKG